MRRPLTVPPSSTAAENLAATTHRRGPVFAVLAAIALAAAAWTGSLAVEALEVGGGGAGRFVAVWTATMTLSVAACFLLVRCLPRAASRVVSAAVFAACAARCLRPSTFADLVREDGVCETLTVAAFAGAAVYMTRAAAHRRRANRGWAAATCGLAATAFVLAAGEEAAWGQRLVGWSTPAWFIEHNNQRELTLHNLGHAGTSRLVDRIAYAVGFLALAALPTFSRRFRDALQRASFEPPALAPILTATLAVFCTSRAAYGRRWDAAALTLAGALVLVVVARRSSKEERSTVFAAAFAALFAATCFVFVPPATERSGELKECALAVACLLYAARLRDPPSLGDNGLSG